MEGGTGSDRQAGRRENVAWGTDPVWVGDSSALSYDFLDF